MALLTLSQLRTAVTDDEALQMLLDELQSLGFNASSWQSGSKQRLLLTAFARAYSGLSTIIATLATFGNILLAEDDACTEIAKSHYDTDRNLAIKTQGLYRLTSTAAIPYTIEAGQFLLSTTGGTEFSNTTGGTLAAGGTLDVTIEALIAGSDSNVGDGTITVMKTPLAGVTGVNVDAGSGTWITQTGVDEESTPALRTRSTSRWANLSIELVRDGAKNVLLNASSGIKKVDIDGNNPRGAGTADYYIAGVNSVASGADVVAAQAAIDARIFGNTGTPPRHQVIASSASTLTIVGTIYHDPSYTAANVQVAVEQALNDFIEATPLGGWDYYPGPTDTIQLNDIENAIKNAEINGVKVVLTVTLTVPAADVAVAAYSIVVPGSFSGLSYVAVTG